MALSLNMTQALQNPKGENVADLIRQRHLFSKVISNMDPGLRLPGFKTRPHHLPPA